MRVTTDVFWAGKHGSQPHEYEDAYWPLHRLVEVTTDVFGCAIADGATESSYSRLWAKQLSRAAGLRLPSDEAALRELLRPLQKQWAGYVAQRIQKHALPWYVEEKASSGAFAALLSLQLDNTNNWRAVAVGDCCVAHLRKARLCQSFPLTRAAEFTQRPYLLSSLPARNGLLHANLHVADGNWQAGDVFLLMTDALAHWSLAEAEAGAEPWQTLICLDPDDAAGFETWLAPLRSARAIRNDDVTLLRVCVT